MKKLLLLLTFFNNCQFLQSSHNQLSIEELAATLSDEATNFLLNPEIKEILNTKTPIRRSIRRPKKPLFFSKTITTDPRSSHQKRRCTNLHTQLDDFIEKKQEEIEEKTIEESKSEQQSTESSSKDIEDAEDTEEEYTPLRKNTPKQILKCPVDHCEKKIHPVNTTVLFHFIMNHGKKNKTDNTCPLKGCNYILDTKRGADALRAHIGRHHPKDDQSSQMRFLGFCKNCKLLIPHIHKETSAKRLLLHENHNLTLVLTRGPFNPEKIKKGRIAQPKA